MLPLLPFVTAHVWPVGCVLTVTFQPSPEVNPVGNVNGPLPSADNVCVPAVVVSVSFRSTLFEPVRPLTPEPAAVPATVYVFVVHVTVTLVTFAVMLALLPFVTAHVWPVGCVLTVTFQPSPEV